MRPTATLATVVRPRIPAAPPGPWGAVAAAASQVQHWAHGAEGRRRTGRELRKLDAAGWQVNHRIEVSGGVTVDHLAIGPSGVYVLDSRAWAGVVTVDYKGATITPKNDPSAAWTAYGHHRALPPAAAAVVRGLAAVTGARIRAPRAVVVIWAAFPERVAVSGSLTYVAGEHLARWLSDQPRQLDERQLSALSVVSIAGRAPTQRSLTPRNRSLVQG
jgi:hypothetical protein